jgi:hypothetical protein
VPKVGTNQRTRDLPHGRTLHSFIARSGSTLLSAIGIEVLRRGTAADGLGLLHYEHAPKCRTISKPRRGGIWPSDRSADFGDWPISAEPARTAAR